MDYENDEPVIGTPYMRAAEAVVNFIDGALGVETQEGEGVLLAEISRIIRAELNKDSQ